MDLNAINKVRSFIKQGQWHNYLIILPTTYLVQRFIDILLDEDVKGVLYPKIYTLDGFVEEVFNSRGIFNVYVNDIYKLELLKKIINKLQNKGQLNYFSGVVRHSIVQHIDAAIIDLKQAGISAPNFNQAIQVMENTRLSDLALIYSVYAQELEIRGLKDREDRFVDMLQLLEMDPDLLTGIDYVYADWFMDNTFIQEQIFTLIKAQIPANAINLYQPKMAKPAFVTVYNERGRAGEVEVAMHEVIRLLESGVALKDIAIVVRNPQIYASLLVDFFDKVNLIVDIDIQKPLITSPIIKSVMLWFDLASQANSSFALDVLLNNHYLIDKSAITLLTLNWARQKGCHTMAEWISLWQAEAELLRDALGDGYDAVNNILANVLHLWSSIPSVGKAPDILAALIHNINSLALENRISIFNPENSLEERLELAQREHQALNSFRDMLNDLLAVEAQEGRTTKLSYILKDINNYLNDRSYLYKKSTGQGIAVLTPTEIRGLGFHTVLILGMEEGVFPKKLSPNLLLKDAERLSLRPGLTLPLTTEIYERETMLFSFVLQACRENLVLTYPGTDEDGGPNLASLFIYDVLEEYKSASSIAAYEPEFNNIAIKPVLEHLLMVENWRNSANYSPYEGSFSETAIINLIKAKVAEQVFSISTLNNYANCPMKYFLVNELGLTDMVEADGGVSKVDLGSLKHEVLALVLAEHATLTIANLDLIVTSTVEKVCAQKGYTGDNYPDIWLWEKEKSNIVDSLVALIAAELERGDFKPHLFEWGFGFDREFFLAREENSKTGEVNLERIYFRGKIDRIDKDNDGRLAIYDYKESAYMTRLDIEAAKELQLPLYVMAASKLIGEVVGSAYIEIKHSKPKHFFYKDTYKNELGVGNIRTKGLNEEEWLKWLDNIKLEIFDYMAGLSRGYFPPTPHSCSYCHLFDICFYNPARNRRKALGTGGISE